MRSTAATGLCNDCPMPHGSPVPEAVRMRVIGFKRCNWCSGPWLPNVAGALAGLLRDNLAGAADIGWKVLELREPITHRQHCFCIVDVHLRLEHQVWDGRGKNVDHLQRRMGCHEMTAAQPTELAMAEVFFLVGPNVLRALKYLDLLCRPERECINRAAGPRTA